MHPFGLSENIVCDGSCLLCACKQFAEKPMPDPDPRPLLGVIRELQGRWRPIVNGAEGHIQALYVQGAYEAQAYERGKADGRRFCVDELQAVLDRLLVEGRRSDQRLFVLMKCFDYGPGDVEVVASYWTEAEADTACRTAETHERTLGKEVCDAFWVEAIDLPPDRSEIERNR